MKLLLQLVLLGIIPLILNDINNNNIFTSSQLHSCTSGNCSHYSLVDLLVNFSSDVTIYITTDTVLYSVIQ